LDRQLVSTLDPNFAPLAALRDAGFGDNYNVWLPKYGDPDTIYRYIIVGGGIWWIPDETYTRA
jgi:hypothetical protein